MATPNLEDLLARTLPAALTGLEDAVGQLKAALSQSKTTQSTKVGPEDKKDSQGLSNMMDEMVEGFKTMREEQKAFLDSVVEAVQSIKGERQSRRGKGEGSSGGDSDASEKSSEAFLDSAKETKIIQDGILKIAKNNYTLNQITGKQKIAVAIKEMSMARGMSEIQILQRAMMDDAFADEIANKAKSIQLNAANLADARELYTKILPAGRDELSEYNSLLYKQENQLYHLQNQISSISRGLEDFSKATGLEVAKTAFSDLYQTEMQYTQEMRQIAFETAGATKENRSLQQSFEQIGKTVAATGVNRTKFQESYKKALRGGVKDLKQAVSLTTAQLNAEKQIGVEAGSLQETFQSFAQAGRMTNMEVSQVGRGMRDVALRTGMTGDALRSAVESSKEFIDTMRKASTLSASAATNVIELSANAKKLGVEQEMNALAKGLSGTNALLNESSSETRTLILLAAQRVGKTNDVMNGTLLKTKQGIKAFATGMKGVLAGFGVESVEAIDNLSDEAKKVLNLRLKATVGMELGAFRSIIESYDEAGKSLGERLSDVDKQLNKNITTEERKALLEQKRAMQTGKAMEVLTVLDEQAKGAKNMGEALAKFGAKRQDFEEDLQGLGIAWGNETDVMKQTLESAIAGVNKGLKDAGKSELKLDQSAIESAMKDPSAFREITAQITKGQQELATAQKSQLDPVSETNQKLTEINDTLRNMSQNVISNIFNSVLGKIIVVGGVLAGISSLALKLVGSGVATNKSLRELIMGSKEQFRRNSSGDIEAYKEREGILGNLKALFAEKLKPPVETTAATSAAAAAAAEAKSATAPIVPPPEKPAPKTPEAPKPKPEASPTQRATEEAAAAAQKEKESKDKKIESEEGKKSKRELRMERAERRLLREKQKTSKMEYKDAVQSDKAGPSLPSGMPDPSSLKKLGGDMVKTGAAILVMAAGAVLLGSAIVFLSQKIISSFGLDTQKIMETAMVVGAVAAAGGAIAAAGVAAFEALTNPEALEFRAKAKAGIGQFVKTGIALMILGPGVVLLGAAVVSLTNLVLKTIDVDVNKVTETSAIVGALGAAAAGLAYGVSEFLNFWDDLKKSGAEKKLRKWQIYAKRIAIGSVALLGLGTIITGLGVAVVAMAKGIMNLGGMDSTMAAKVAKDLAILLGSVGLISLALVGSMVGLQALGAFVTTLNTPIAGQTALALMVIGAGALLGLSFVVPLLARGVLAIANSAATALGGTQAKTIEAAKNVGTLMLAAGAIALGLVGALYGLKWLGILALTWKTAALQIALGAVALMGLSFVIVPLAKAVLGITKASMTFFGVDPKKSAEVAEAFGSLIWSAGKIALGILASVGVMAGLGALLYSMPVIIPLIAAGALAFLALGPSIAALANSVVSFTGDALQTMISPSTAKEIADSISTIVSSAGDIAWAITSAAAKLAGIGVLSIAAGLIGWLASNAVNALDTLMIPITGFVLSIVRFSSLLGSVVDPKNAVSMAEGVAEILGAVGDATEKIISVQGQILKVKNSKRFWIFGSTISDRLWEAGDALTDMTSPIAYYLLQIANFTKRISGIVPPQQAADMASTVGDILSAAGTATEAIVNSGSKLSYVPQYAGFFDYIRGVGIGDRITSAKVALFEMTKPLVGYLQTVKTCANMLKAGVGTDPANMKEYAEGVGMMLDAAGQVTASIATAGKAVASIRTYDGIYSYLVSSIPDQMRTGIAALHDISQPLVTYLQTVVRISNQMKDATKGIGFVKLVERADTIAKILESAGKITKLILDTKDSVSALQESSIMKAIFGSAADSMHYGVLALDGLAYPTANYLKTVVMMADRLKNAVGGDGLGITEKAQFLQAVLTTAGKITGLISQAKNDLKDKLGGGGGFFGGGDLAKPLNKGVATLTSLIPAMSNYMTTIKNMTNQMSAAISEDEYKAVSDGLRRTTNIIQNSATVLGTLNEKIVPLIKKSGFFTKPPIQEMAVAVKAITTFFPKVKDFFGTVVSQTNSATTSAEAANDSARRLAAMSIIFNSIADSLKILHSRIAPLAQEGTFRNLSADVIRSAIKVLAGDSGKEGLVPQIIEFVNVAILAPMKNFPKFEEILNAARQMGALGTVIQYTSTIMTNAYALMKKGIDGYVSTSELNKTASPQNQKNFQNQFNSIMGFISNTIVGTITGTAKGTAAGSFSFPSKQKIMEAAQTLEDMSGLMCVIGGTLGGFFHIVEMLTTVESDTSSKGAFFEAKEKYMERFRMISQFFKMGIVDTVNKDFKDQVANLKMAGAIMEALGKVATNIVPVVSNLFTAVESMTKLNPDTASNAMAYIEKHGKVFGEFFKKVTGWIKSDIVQPLIDNFKDVNITQASTIARSLQETISSIPPILTGLENTINMMSKEMATGKGVDTTFAVDLIKTRGKEFGKAFQEILTTTKTEMLDPLISIFAQNDLQEYNKKLEGLGVAIPRMAGIVKMIANDIIPLVVTPLSKVNEVNEELAAASAQTGKASTPDAEKLQTTAEFITENMSKIGPLFSSIAELLSKDILAPIATLPDTTIIATYAEKLRNTTAIIKDLFDLMNFLGEALAPRKTTKCLNDAPIVVLAARAVEFKGWFGSIYSLIQDGIIAPVLKFPDASVVTIVKEKVSIVMQFLNELTPMLQKLASMFVPLDPSKILSQAPAAVLGQNAVMFAEWFSGIVALVKYGIVEPVKNNLPDKKDIQIVLEKIYNTMEMLVPMPDYLTMLGMVVAKLNPDEVTGGPTALSKLAGETKDYQFWFSSISEFVGSGLVDPILKYLPNETQVETSLQKLNGMNQIMAKLPDYLTKTSEVFSNISSSPQFKLSANMFRQTTTMMTEFLSELASFMNAGMVNPIEQNFPNVEKLTIVSQQIQAMTLVAKEFQKGIIEFVKTMATVDEVMNIQKTKGFDVQKLAGFSTSLSDALKLGLMYPLQTNLPKIEEMKALVNQLDLTLTVVDKIEKIMTLLAEKMQSIFGITSGMSSMEEMFSGAKSVSFSATENLTANLEKEDEKKRISSARNLSPVNDQYELQRLIMQQKASVEPEISKISSDELSEIASDTNKQTSDIGKLVNLFTQMLSLMNTRASVISRGEANANGSTMVNKVTEKPPVYNRSLIGLPAAQTSENVLNMGPPGVT